ncbi:hypothetical protein DDZ16_06085 [Marinilabilia rubra]|uniref:Uncharacterized protein n=1 Tax=Marinilabilia rubra TaxID=2162893 RepID=A0A2U2BBP5_9BACT|nr:hypothetical protein DDZ16_06085 [Marinilabilia rubra]
MPKNKLASFRYRVINNCLRNTGRKWNRQDLINEISDQHSPQPDSWKILPDKYGSNLRAYNYTPGHALHDHHCSEHFC